MVQRRAKKAKASKKAAPKKEEQLGVHELVDEDYPEDNELAVDAIVDDMAEHDPDAAEVLRPEVVGHPMLPTDGEDPVKFSKSVRRIQQEASTKEKQRIALQLRLAGLTYAQIADRLGYKDQSSARAIVTTAMDTYTFGEVKDIRNLVFARLEHLLTLNWQEAMRKDPQATAIVLGITDRLTKLMGLDDHARFGDDGEVQTEGVLTIGGSKDQYIEGLRNARKALNRGDE